MVPGGVIESRAAETPAQALVLFARAVNTMDASLLRSLMPTEERAFWSVASAAPKAPAICFSLHAHLWHKAAVGTSHGKAIITHRPSTEAANFGRVLHVMLDDVCRRHMRGLLTSDAARIASAPMLVGDTGWGC